MYLIFDDGYYDSDLLFLHDLFEVLDRRLDRVQKDIDESFDPDMMGCFDDAEYFSGMGLIACQRYLTSTYGPLGLNKKLALSMGPVHSGGETYVRIINAGANFWKHKDEWDFSTVVNRDRSNLEPVQSETIRILETVTAWDDYTCANLLFSLVKPNEPRLRNLLPLLEQWRAALAALSL